MHARALGLLAAAALAPTAAAQVSDASSSSEHVIELKKVLSTDGDTDEQHYRKVVVNGEVVEESGDPGIALELELPGRSLERLEIGDLLKGLDLGDGVVIDVDVDAHADAHADGDVQSRTVERRVVVENGEVVVDEEIVDGKPVEPRRGRRPADLDFDDFDLDLDGRGLPKELEDLLEQLGGDRGNGRAIGGGATTRTVERRVVVENGEVVVDEEIVDGKPVDRPRGGRRVRVGGGADAWIERLLDGGVPRGPAPRAIHRVRIGGDGHGAPRPRVRTFRLDQFGRADSPILDLGRSWSWDTRADVERLNELADAPVTGGGRVLL